MLTHAGVCWRMLADAVFKSRLLLEYSLIDKRFAKLVVLVKAWAKARSINSAAHGTFNSFGLSLLVVHYLQVCCVLCVLCVCVCVCVCVDGLLGVNYLEVKSFASLYP
jgi:DNA polymerase sigma